MATSPNEDPQQAQAVAVSEPSSADDVDTSWVAMEEIRASRPGEHVIDFSRQED